MTPEPKQWPMLMRGPLVLRTLAGAKDVTRRLDMRWLRAKPGDLIWIKETFALEHDFNKEGPSQAVGRTSLIHFLADGPKPVWAGKTRVSIHLPKAFARLWLAVVSVREERVQDITKEDARREGVEPYISQESWSVLRKDGSGYDCFVEPEPDEEIAAFVHVPARELIDAKGRFATLWEEINGRRPGCRWMDNPAVARVEFARIPDSGGGR